jgi:chromosome transmission fidelity protein 8
MRIPIKFNSFANSTGSLPPQLAQLASNEMILIELQGSLEVEGDKTGEVVGTLKVDNPVRLSFIQIYNITSRQSLG